MYKEVKPGQTPAWDFEMNKEFEGTLTKVRTEVGPNKSMLYEFDLDNGEKASVWGSAGLDNTMSEVQTGTKVKIVFEGLKTNENTGREFKAFRVYVDERE